MRFFHRIFNMFANIPGPLLKIQKKNIHSSYVQSSVDLLMNSKYSFLNGISQKASPNVVNLFFFFFLIASSWKYLFVMQMFTLKSLSCSHRTAYFWFSNKNITTFCSCTNFVDLFITEEFNWPWGNLPFFFQQPPNDMFLYNCFNCTVIQFIFWNINQFIDTESLKNKLFTIILIKYKTILFH